MEEYPMNTTIFNTIQALFLGLIIFPCYGMEYTVEPATSGNNESVLNQLINWQQDGILLNIFKQMVQNDYSEKAIQELNKKREISRKFNSLLSHKEIKKIVRPEQEFLNHKLLEAAQEQNLSKGLCFIQLGSNVNCKNNDNKRPLHLAIPPRQSKVKKKFLQKLFNFKKDQPIKEVPPFLTMLIEHKADLNRTERDKKTPLHYAVENDQLSSIIYLLNHQANPNIQDRDGRTPLHYAIQNKQYAIAEQLLKHQANPNIQDRDGKTPIFYVGKCSSLGKLLNQYNADNTITDNTGNTSGYYFATALIEYNFS